MMLCDDVATLREYFKAGFLKSIRIEREPLMQIKWRLVVVDQGFREHVLCTARGEVRLFASIDTALNTAESIGFKIDVFTMREFT